MPIDTNIQTDKNQCGFSLPTSCCVGDGVGDPFAGGKAGGAKPTGGGYPGAHGDPFIGGKSAGKAGAQGGAIQTIVSGPDLPNDHDTDDPNRS